MKQIISLFAFLFITANFIGQEWTDLLPDKDKNELTFYDYQNAFTEYWDDYNVVKGKYIDSQGIQQKAYGWKQFKRWEHFWEPRVDKKTGNFPKEEMHEAYSVYLKQVSSINTKADWTAMGPSTTPGGYAGLGRVNTVAFHPSDNNTFWIGAPAGGIWVTTSGGNDWQALSENNEVQGVSAIIIPSDYETSSTIYIGTGDRDAFDNVSVGVLKSTDGGNTWLSTGLSFNTSEGEVVNNMLIHPSDNDIIYAATSAGFYKTTDAAVTWVEKNPIEFVDVEFHPSDPSIIYGSTRFGHIYKTADHGETWTQIFQSVSGRRIELAVSIDAPNRLYILAGNNSNGLEGIYRSDDSGATIDLIFNSLNLLNWSTNGGGTNDGQAWYDLSFAADPNDADIVYCGGVNTWKSVDGGLSWSLNNHWYGGGGVQAVHADKHYFKFRHNTSELFECNDGGIYHTTDGTSWTDLTNTLYISQIYGLSTAQTDPDVTIIGLQDNGTKVRNNGVWDDVIGGDGMKCLVDFEDENTQYGSLYYGEIYRTYDMWISDDNISPDGQGAWVTPYVLDPNDPNTLYVGYNSLFKSTNQGTSYEVIGTFGALRTITVSNANSDIICVGTYGNISKTLNGGISWNDITNNLPSAGSSITDIAIKFDDPDVIWVTLSGYNSDGVYETLNGGDSWTNISQGLPDVPVNTVIQNRFETNLIQLYAGTDFGVYIKNGNSDWSLYGNNMPKIVISELDIYYDNDNPVNSRLRTSTYGRGLWEIPLDLSGNFAPFVSSVEITDITENSAVSTGNIDNDYGSTVTESGFVISESPNPNLQTPDALIFQTDPLVTIGEFTVDLVGLNPGTNYYCKAYAMNANGTGYGNELIFNTDCSTISSLPYDEGFENNGLFPICWTEEILVGSVNWNFGELANYEPYEGNYYAYFRNSTINEDRTLLIAPIFDFSAQNNLTLSFWHIQPELFSYQDELRVLYKNDVNDNWTEIGEFTENVTGWTYREFDLVNLSDTYYIAFEGISKGGRGIGIDDLIIGLNTSIEDEFPELSIIPNPSDGIFRIEGIDEGSFNISVFTSLGKLIYSDLHHSNIIDLTFLSKGLYFLQFEFNEKTITEKLIIK